VGGCGASFSSLTFRCLRPDSSCRIDMAACMLATTMFTRSR